MYTRSAVFRRSAVSEPIFAQAFAFTRKHGDIAAEARCLQNACSRESITEGFGERLTCHAGGSGFDLMCASVADSTAALISLD
jgi:hypothetical protein